MNCGHKEQGNAHERCSHGSHRGNALQLFRLCLVGGQKKPHPIIFSPFRARNSVSWVSEAVYLGDSRNSGLVPSQSLRAPLLIYYFPKYFAAWLSLTSSPTQTKMVHVCQSLFFLAIVCAPVRMIRREPLKSLPANGLSQSLLLLVLIAIF